MALLSLRTLPAARAALLTLSLSASACSLDWKDKGTAADPMDNMDGGLDDDAGDAPDASPVVETGDDTPDAGPDAASDEPVTSCDDPSTAQCMPGDTVACTTSCGTQGSGACSDSCGQPVGAACTPPQEVCNWIDDDCDGAIDPGMLVQDPSKTRAVTLSKAQVTTPILLAREGGGAWLLYVDNESVRAQLLNEDAQFVDTSYELVPAQVGAVRAAAAGPNIVVATSHQDGDSAFIMVRVYDSKDLSPVGDYRLPGLTGKCISHGVYRLAAFTLPNGDLRIAVLRWKATGTYDAANVNTCWQSLQGSAELVALTHTKAGTWPTPFVARTFGSVSLFGPTASHVERAPCRDEWLLFTPPDSGTGWNISRYTGSGSAVSVNFAKLAQGWIVASTPYGTCTDGGQLALVRAFTDGSTTPPKTYGYFHHLQFGSNGALLEMKESPLDPGFVAGAAVARGNRLSIVGLELTRGAMLLDYGPGAPQAERVLSPTEAVSDVALLALAVAGHAMTSIADTGRALAVAITNLNAGQNQIFDAYRPVGDTNPVGAVVYGIGCPSTP